MCRFDDKYLESLIGILVNDYFSKASGDNKEVKLIADEKIQNILEIFKRPENRVILENYLIKIDDVSMQYNSLTLEFHNQVNKIISENISNDHP